MHHLPPPGFRSLASPGRDRGPDGRLLAPRQNRYVTDPITVFLLDDHEIVRRGVRDLLEAEDDIVVVGEASTEDGGGRARARARSRRRRARRAPAGGQRGRGVPRDPVAAPAHGVPDADVVRRRRGAVRGDHGRRGRVRAQADPRQRPGRCRAARGRRAEPARPGRHGAGARTAAARDRRRTSGSPASAPRSGRCWLCSPRA